MMIRCHKNKASSWHMKSLIMLIFSAGLVSSCATQTSVVSDNFASMDGMLLAHNQVRVRHRLAPLRWSGELASYSQDWANYLAGRNQCRMKHRYLAGKDYWQAGENLFWASPVSWSDGRLEPQQIRAGDVVRAWAEEQRDYDYRSNSCRSGKQCVHYTQLVWRDTTHVGCAMVLCSNSEQLWVCSYSPAGNWQGQKPY